VRGRRPDAWTEVPVIVRSARDHLIRRTLNADRSAQLQVIAAAGIGYGITASRSADRGGLAQMVAKLSEIADIACEWDTLPVPRG
jgi:hypothetical protein